VAQSKRKGQPAQSGGQNTFYIVLGVIVLAGVIAIFFAVRGGGGGAVSEPIALDITDSRQLYDQATPKRIGEDAAPTKVVVFSDFQCPGCGAFALQERPRLMPYVERGEVQFIAYDYPLGGAFVHSFLAARAARCAGDQPATGTVDGTAYWPFHDVLYAQQSRWSGQRTQQAVIDDFVGYARELNLDTRSFEQCVRSDRHADVVTANRMVGDQLGVQGTPTVLVNNRRVSGRTINEMGNEVLRLLGDAAGQGNAGPR
jgi:protein-disulfide isomerase